MDNKEISIVSEAKYLGIWLDQKLNWHRHIEETVAKSKRLIFTVNRTTRLKWGLSSEVLRILWRQAFEPIILYSCPIWSPALRNHILLNKLH